MTGIFAETVGVLGTPEVVGIAVIASVGMAGAYKLLGKAASIINRRDHEREEQKHEEKIEELRVKTLEAGRIEVRDKMASMPCGEHALKIRELEVITAVIRDNLLELKASQKEMMGLLIIMQKNSSPRGRAP